MIKPISDGVMQKVINQSIQKNTINAIEPEHTPNDQTHIDDMIFSIVEAKKFTGDNAGLAYELFGMFRAELDNYKVAIEAALRKNDLAGLRAQAHKLHGASRCCGTTEVQQRSSYLEKLIDQNIEFDIAKETGLLLTAIDNVANYQVNKSE